MTTVAPKHRGELAELKFQFIATQKGLVVSKPLGDNQPYDYVVEKEGTLFKVQVKSSKGKNSKGTYLVTIRKNNDGKPYTKTDYDYVAVHLFDCNAWYLIPFSHIGNHFYIGANDPYNEYKENWSFNG